MLTVRSSCGWKTRRLRLTRVFTPQADVKVLSTVYLSFRSAQLVTSVKTPTGHPGEAVERLSCVLDVAQPPWADAGVDSSMSPAMAAMPSTTMALNEFFDISSPFHDRMVDLRPAREVRAPSLTPSCGRSEGNISCGLTARCNYRTNDVSSLTRRNIAEYSQNGSSGWSEIGKCSYVPGRHFNWRVAPRVRATPYINYRVIGLLHAWRGIIQLDSQSPFDTGSAITKLLWFMFLWRHSVMERESTLMICSQSGFNLRNHPVVPLKCGLIARILTDTDTCEPFPGGS